MCQKRMWPRVVPMAETPGSSHFFVLAGTSAPLIWPVPGYTKDETRQAPLERTASHEHSSSPDDLHYSG
jgi:hypothetical protein